MYGAGDERRHVERSSSRHVLGCCRGAGAESSYVECRRATAAEDVKRSIWAGFKGSSAGVGADNLGGWLRQGRAILAFNLTIKSHECKGGNVEGGIVTWDFARVSDCKLSR